jgi:hypothetical protein
VIADCVTYIAASPASAYSAALVPRRRWSYQSSDLFSDGLGRYRPVVAELGGRSVDVEHPIHRPNSKQKWPVCSGFGKALCRTRTDDPLLTILGRARESRVRQGHRDHESAANRRDLTRGRDPRVDARGQADVRTTFAWTVRCTDTLGLGGGHVIRSGVALPLGASSRSTSSTSSRWSSR